MGFLMKDCSEYSGMGGRRLGGGTIPWGGGPECACTMIDPLSTDYYIGMQKRT